MEISKDDSRFYTKSFFARQKNGKPHWNMIARCSPMNISFAEISQCSHLAAEKTQLVSWDQDICQKCSVEKNVNATVFKCRDCWFMSKQMAEVGWLINKILR
jgi:hypothetical protein